MEHSSQNVRLRQAKPGSFTAESFAALERILTSQAFHALQEQTAGFLRYIVETRLLGLSDTITETEVAKHAYGSKAHDPRETRKIAMAAAMLRAKLVEYYLTEGAEDPILIEMPLGTYVPTIKDRRRHVMLNPFDDWTPKRDISQLCLFFLAELERRLSSIPRVCIWRSDGKTPIANDAFVVSGAVACSGELLSVHFSLLRDLPKTLKGDCFNGSRDDVGRLSQTIADRIAHGLDVTQNTVRIFPIRGRHEAGGAERDSAAG